ncbi:hypothetical protein [Celeribacter indicus]|uniref:Lipoprotein n=1 Tax=Celeribacter indicus TaxID=1208324 RepID=A0A0B5DX24_9RHOB|nr:hypothetical protein [Celeribacter indicus]AJE45296.1 hypothetical protein P73_0581 [Celeribacter indicus]SDX20557.1 hypothetical protein SAMN05443573_11746 [Celeribacter indicus]
MRQLPILVSVLLLSGCAADSPGLAAARYASVDVGENSYRVYTEETRDCVEVHRINPVFPPPSRRLVLIEMETAVVQVTGCRLERGSFVGDQAITKGRLDCTGSEGAPRWVEGTCKTRPWGRWSR